MPCCCSYRLPCILLSGMSALLFLLCCLAHPSPCLCRNILGDDVISRNHALPPRSVTVHRPHSRVYCCIMYYWLYIIFLTFVTSNVLRDQHQLPTNMTLTKSQSRSTTSLSHRSHLLLILEASHHIGVVSIIGSPNHCSHFCILYSYVVCESS